MLNNGYYTLMVNKPRLYQGLLYKSNDIGFGPFPACFMQQSRRFVACEMKRGTEQNAEYTQGGSIEDGTNIRTTDRPLQVT